MPSQQSSQPSLPAQWNVYLPPSFSEERFRAKIALAQLEKIQSVQKSSLRAGVALCVVAVVAILASFSVAIALKSVGIYHEYMSLLDELVSCTFDQSQDGYRCQLAWQHTTLVSVFALVSTFFFAALLIVIYVVQKIMYRRIIIRRAKRTKLLADVQPQTMDLAGYLDIMKREYDFHRQEHARDVRFLIMDCIVNGFALVGLLVLGVLSLSTSIDFLTRSTCYSLSYENAMNVDDMCSALYGSLATDMAVLLALLLSWTICFVSNLRIRIIEKNRLKNKVLLEDEVKIQMLSEAMISPQVQTQAQAAELEKQMPLAPMQPSTAEQQEN